LSVRGSKFNLKWPGFLTGLIDRCGERLVL
jgi:hypothetical protein